MTVRLVSNSQTPPHRANGRGHGTEEVTSMQDQRSDRRKPCGCGCGQLAPLSALTDRRRGVRKGDPLRFVNGHNTTIPADVEHDYVVEDHGYDTPCWIWQKTQAGEGYGFAQRNGQRTMAHRFYYEQYVGPVPKGADIHHRCEVKLCVNPAHLKPVTRTVHACLLEDPRSKLTIDDVRAIRAARGFSRRALARKFGVHHQTIGNILDGISWKGVE